MKDFSQALLARMDTIIEKWIEGVRSDEQIASASQLPYKTVLDNLPRVLRAIATILSESGDSDIQNLVQASLEHGVLRAEQGYDAAEIAREYRILRWVMFAVLEEDLLKGTSLEMVRAFRTIDTAIDEGIARCFKSYTDERLRELENLQAQLKLNNQELMRLVREVRENIFQFAREFQTPLQSIISSAEQFLKQQEMADVKDNFPKLEDIKRLFNQGRELLSSINDAVEFYRYEMGKVDLQRGPINPRAAIACAAELMEPLARSKNLELKVECDRAPERVVTDPLRFQEIVTHLLRDAIRRTFSGCIKINCTVLSDSQWSVTVSGADLEIELEKGERSSEPETQVIESHFPEKPLGGAIALPDSANLELAIASRAVDLLQGRIERRSEVDVGSAVAVILPLEVEAPCQNDTAEATEDKT